MPKGKPEPKTQPPMAIILEEFTPEVDPWRSIQGRPGIRILSTARRMPGE